MTIHSGLLTSFPLLQGLDTQTISSISAAMDRVDFKRGETVMNQGADADKLGFLITGQLQVVSATEDGREIGIGMIAPGQHFGELAIIDGRPRSATVMASKDSMVGFLTATFARALIQNNPLIAGRFLVQLASTVRGATQKISLLSIQNASQRVYAQVHMIAGNTQEGQALNGLPSQREIAMMVNTSRETVTRSLGVLLKLNILSRDGGKLILNRSAQLQRAAIEGLENSAA